ncbi:MAG TPA: 30S ribosomal protein S16 [Candidatus Saccharimonadia bacterium]|nr:30S ribosomal protein S16 [Candidatus Saccharimonadia bacterium]
MQRTGRKGTAHFRMIVQDSRRTPTSGNIVELLGNYNPHTKEAIFNKERVEFYLNNGAQPTPRVVRILTQAKIKLPTWIKNELVKKRTIKNPDKLRKNRPKEKTPVAEEDKTAPEAEENKVDISDVAQPDKEEAPKVETEEVKDKEAEKEAATGDETAIDPETEKS